MDNLVDGCLVKIAAQCNIQCDYCYWFRDPTVYDLPSVMPTGVMRLFLNRLDEHLRDYRLDVFRLSLHGGEPLLLRYEKLAAFLLAIRAIEQARGVPIHITLQTNGMLVDDSIAALLRDCGVSVGISLDGPQAQNDLHRKDRQGHGTYSRAIAGYQKLKAAGHNPGLLMVWQPGLTVESVTSLVGELGCNWFDVLLPDRTHDDPHIEIGPFFEDLFCHWLDHMYPAGITLRYALNAIRTLLGIGSTSESVGTAPARTFSIGPEGAFYLLDVLNIVEPGRASTGLHLSRDPLQSIQSDPHYREQLSLSSALPTPCIGCTFGKACGGGYLPSRWSAANGFDNRSSNCGTLFGLFDLVKNKLDLAQSFIVAELANPLQSPSLGDR